MPDDRSEIHTPKAIKHLSHLKHITQLIPDLEPDAQILLLLAWDILQVKVRDKCNGSNNDPYAQRLDLGGVIVGEVCRDAAHKPKGVSTYGLMLEWPPLSLQPMSLPPCFERETYSTDRHKACQLKKPTAL